VIQTFNNASSGDDPQAPFLAAVIDRLIQDPPRTWSEENREGLKYAVETRYRLMRIPVPTEVASVMHLMEILGQNNQLVKVIQRTRPRTLDAYKEMLASVEMRDFGYQQVAGALLYVSITQGGQAFNAVDFISALREHRAGQRLDWQDVVHALHQDGLRITKQQFLHLYRALLPLAQEYENFDLQTLWGGAWTDPEAQLSFVVAFLSCTAEEIDAAQIPRLRKAFTEEEFESATSQKVKDAAAKYAHHPMVSLDAVQVLFSTVFRSQETYAQAQSMVQTVINPNTQSFVVSASAVPKPWGGLQDQALRQLFMTFFNKTVEDYEFVLYGLWYHDNQWVAERLLEVYLQNPLILPTILEHAETHGWTRPLIMLGADLSLDLAALAHAKGMFDMEEWAQQMFQQMPQPFTAALRGFLLKKAESDLQTQREKVSPTTVPLAVKTVYPLLGLLQGHLVDEELVQLQRQCIQTYPRLINYGEGFDEIIDKNGTDSNAIPKEADEKMQEHYKKMYAKESEVGEIVEALRKYKNSEDPTDQDLFSCMIHGLFDEYNCFQEYPLDALATTAVLFGGIINYHLLSRIALQTGLAMVLEAVQETQPDDPMYKFGLQALLHFQDRLQEWPSFCDRLLRIPGLMGTEIFSKAQEVVAKHMEEASGNVQNGVTLTNGGNVDDFLAPEPAIPNFNCLRVDPPLRAELYEAPDEEVQDKVLFVLNNVSERNLKDKFKDLKDALEEKHHQWFAEYLVEERAKMQPNYQQLYLDMLDLFNDKTLWAEVLRETYISAFRLLNAESTMTNTTEKTHLKNLGGWLGSLTLARDKPIRFRNISFIDLLLEGYQTNRLVIVIPFTCKVLMQAARSTVFKPPNPWLMEVIRLLRELYDLDDLKLNLKFEIEVMCKDLSLDPHSITPSSAIAARMHPEEEYLANIMPDGLEGFNELSLMRQRGPSGRFSPAAIAANLPDFSSQLVFPPVNGVAGTQRLRQIFLQAAQQAIYEIIAPVVERSVTIAAISTSQLVEKDFALEPDEQKYIESAHTMVKSLSGSLALVTCKEPLRMSITNNIRMLARDLPDNIPEGVIIMFVNDNLDTICSLVEQAAETQSIAEIDMQIEEAVRKRRLHRSTRTSEPFKDNIITNWAFYIPEPYKQSIGGLNREQMAIYQDFGRQTRGLAAHANAASQDSGRQVPDVLQDQFPSVPNLPTPAEAPAVPRQTQQPGRHQPIPTPQQQPSQQVNGYMDAQTLGERAEALLMALVRAAGDAPEEHIEELGPSAPTKIAYEDLISLLVGAGPQKEMICLSLAAKVTGLLYSDTERRFEIEVLVRLLANLCELSVQTGRQVIIWLGSMDDDRLFNAPITVCLIAAGLVDLHRIDATVAKAIQQQRPVAIEFLSTLMDDLLLSDNPNALRSDFVQSFEALTQLLAREPDAETARHILDKLHGPQPVQAPPTPTGPNKDDQFDYIFAEWIQLMRPDTPERTLASFVAQLHENHVISTKEDTLNFFRACVEASVISYELEEQSPVGNLDRAYINVDAFARLVVSLVVFQGEADGAVKESKAKYLDSILSLIILDMCHHQRIRREHFNHKVFFRLFSSILCELHSAGAALAGFEKDVFLVFGKALKALQPKYFPTFSFQWLGLIAHRILIPELLKSEDDVEQTETPVRSAGWDLYTDLIETVLAYSGELVKPVEVSTTGRAFYRGVLRVLLVIHHDFPEFLAENHFRLCNAIPMHCSQIRNLIVSAYPSSFPDLPDPFSAGLKVDRIEEMRKAPAVRGNIEGVLADSGIKDTLDALLNSAEPNEEDISKICEAVYSSKREETGFAFVPITVDVPLLNALVIYIASTTLATQGPKVPAFSPSSPSANILETLAKEFTPEARYHLVSAIANQLRWPNSHTHFFCYAMLHLFAPPTPDQSVLDVQQTITRVLLERLLVHRPHPWGLIITLLEIMKNGQYQFWNLPFVKAAPEVFRMIRSDALKSTV
jgi:CCR4-NOT transcription complex subunit 1